MKETTIDIDGMAANAIAGNILSAIDVSPDRIASFSVQTTVANEDNSGTVFELSAAGADAGMISKQLLSALDWDAFTASSITVRAEIRDGEGHPEGTNTSDDVKMEEPDREITRDRDGGYSWSVHDEPQVDEPEPVEHDTQVYVVLHRLVKEYDNEPLTAKELSQALEGAGESFNPSQTTAALSQLFVKKALVNREKAQDRPRKPFEYWPTEAARDLVDEYGEPV